MSNLILFYREYDKEGVGYMSIPSFLFIYYHLYLYLNKK